MWKTAGEDLTFNLDFKVHDQFIQPDVGSIFVTVRDNDGLAITDWTKKQMPDSNTTSLDFVLPAAINSLTAGNALEARYVRMEYKFGGKIHTQTVSYRLTPFLPIMASPQGVRSRLGATESELPDDDIDVYAAYYALLRLYPDVLPLAITSGSTASLFANNAVEIKAALEMMPGLQQKILQSEAQDNATFTRMKMDMERLSALLEAQLQNELSMVVELIGITEVGSTPSLLLLTTPVNIITTGV